MFEELDDPSPDLRSERTLPAVRARGRVLRRRRQMVTAGGAGAAVAGVALVVVLLLGGQGPDGDDLRPIGVPTAGTSSAPVPGPQEGLPTTAPSESGGTPTPPAVSRSPGPTATPTSTAPPTGEQRLELRGDDLAVTAVGAPRAEAVAALTAVLGEPQPDAGGVRGCVAARDEVAWARFRVGFDPAGRLSGWSSTDPGITTPSGIAVGTTVARLQEVYGDRLQLSESAGEEGVTYSVTDVQMLGSLTGVDGSDRVTALRNGSCTGP